VSLPIYHSADPISWFARAYSLQAS